ncbi:MAG: 4Fe-4S binding protein [Deltaproteobacteria bacterium]|nr:4Fe-4S binding protein [Deltaproteobacteria bacterium]
MNPPEFLIPWIDRFYELLEIDLLHVIANKPLEKEHILKLLRKKKTLKDYSNFDRFLKRAWQRGVVKFLDDRRIAAEDFHIRFDYWALFEGWKDLPIEIKDKLNDWELNHYITSHGQSAKELKNGQPRDPYKIYPEYLLLREVEGLFKRIPKFYLWPCNCRVMLGNCRQSEFTCIRFSNDREIGWEISRGKAMDIVKQANKNGLMQNAELGLDKHGRITGALCNCCSDCCFPHLLSHRLHVQKFWPLSRYMAQPPTEECIKCGKCVQRCPFGIISQEKRIKEKKSFVPVIDVAQCRGCGVCATGCPQGAIKLKQVKESAFEEKFKI